MVELLENTSNFEYISSLDPTKYDFDEVLTKALENDNAKLIYSVVENIPDIFTSVHLPELFDYILKNSNCTKHRIDHVLLKNAARNRKFFLWMSNFFEHIVARNENNSEQYHQFSHEFYVDFARIISELSAHNSIKLWKDFNNNFQNNDSCYMKLFSIFVGHCRIPEFNKEMEKIFFKTLKRIPAPERTTEEYFEVLFELVTFKLRLTPLHDMQFDDDCSPYDLKDILKGYQIPFTDEDFEDVTKERQSFLYDKIALLKYKCQQIKSNKDSHSTGMKDIMRIAFKNKNYIPEHCSDMILYANYSDMKKIITSVLAVGDTRMTEIFGTLKLMSIPKIQTCFITIFIDLLPGPMSGCDSGLSLIEDGREWYRNADKPPNPTDPSMKNIVEKLIASAAAMFQDTVQEKGGRIVETLAESMIYKLFWSHFPFEYLTRLNQTRLLITFTSIANSIFVHWKEIFADHSEQIPAKKSKTKDTKPVPKSCDARKEVKEFINNFIILNFKIFGGSRGVWFYEFLSPDIFITRMIEMFVCFESLIHDDESVCINIYKLVNIYISHLYRRQQDPEIRGRVCKQVFRALKTLTKRPNVDGSFCRNQEKNETTISNDKKRKSVDSPKYTPTSASNLGRACLLILQTENGKFLSRKSGQPDGGKVFEKLESKLSTDNNQLLDEIAATAAAAADDGRDYGQISVLQSTFELLAMRDLFEQKLSQKSVQQFSKQQNQDENEKNDSKELYKLLDRITTNIINKPSQDKSKGESRMEFIKFALSHRSVDSQGHMSTVQVFRQLLNHFRTICVEDSLKKLAKRNRSSNNWLEICGSFAKLHNNSENESSNLLLSSTGNEQCFYEYKNFVLSSAPLLSVIVIHSTTDEFEHILHSCLNVLLKPTDNWTITFYVIELMNGLFGMCAQSSNAIKIQKTKAELLNNEFFARFTERFQTLTGLIFKAAADDSGPLSDSIVVKLLPTAILQLTRSFIIQLLGNNLLTDFNVYQCFHLIAETRCISFHRRPAIFTNLFTEIAQLLTILVQQQTSLIIGMKSSLNDVLVHLLSGLLKAGSKANFEDSQSSKTEESLKKNIFTFGNILKNLSQHKAYGPYAWPLIVQYLELSARNTTQEQIKLALNQAIFPLFNQLRRQLGNDGLQPLFARLNEQSRALFDIVFEHYQHYYNYQGQV